jgi:hypothetical protein
VSDYLPKLAALRTFERALEEGSVILTTHIKKQMKARDFDMNDVISVKETGIIEKDPEPDIKTREWKYTIKGNDIEGETLEIVFSILSERKVKLITGWRKKS